MNNFMSSSHTLNNSSRKIPFRPYSASRRKLKINSSLETPPPIIFTMPNNPKKLSGMGNNIEREQLYENNMQLKDIINKLKRELAETRNQLVKKDLEVKKKERIIKECSKENDIEFVHELNLEKARESTLVSLCKDKYNELKKLYKKKCEENEILKANVKITKIKEFQIQIDILKNEMEKLRKLYLSTLEDNKKLYNNTKEFEALKNKFFEQHKIIKNFMEKCDQYNTDLNDLKEQNSFLQIKLDQSKRQKKELKNINLKLKISNEKYLNQKKLRENYILNINDNQKLIDHLKKEKNEYKKLYELKNEECNKLIKNNNMQKDEEIKRKNEKDSLKPFDFNKIIILENKKEDKDTNKLSLYKSLLDESRHKIEIYELYLKKNGVDKNQLIRAFGFDGIMNSNTRINPEILENEDAIDNGDKLGENENSGQKINDENNKIKSQDNKENLNQDKTEELNKEESSKNANVGRSTTNNDSQASNTATNANTNTLNNPKKLQSIEEKKQEEEEEDNQLLSLLHVFVKNIEAQGVTKEQISKKIEDICKIFEDKKETTKEEFIEPFSKMLIEAMKITQENDIEIVNSFLNEFIDSFNGETIMFFNGLVEVFDNVKDYNGINKDKELSYELNKYKDQLIISLKKYDKNNNHLITFDILRTIVRDLKMILDDEIMEYLIYRMKKDVPENNTIFDLNYEIIEKLVEKNEIGEILNNINNILNQNNTNLDNECKDYVNVVEFQEFKYLIIKKEDFFKVLEKFNISINDELKNSIYELFKVEIEEDKAETINWMEYDKIKIELDYLKNE